MTKEEIWESVLAQIQLLISEANFNTWFKSTKIQEFDSDYIVVSVPNSFAKEWLENKYNKTIFSILNELGERVREIKYVVNYEEPKLVKNNNETTNSSNQLELKDFRINQETNLNPRYTFDNFIVGPFNEVPHAAACAIASDPGSLYNPLFIYGGVGLGKTHLMQAIGNEVVKKFPDKKVYYISSEKFISGVISAIRERTMDHFKSRYREVDVLIIDDIQFLSGKEKTQEEFFHTFNTLYENNKQIILSSDRPPRAIQSLAERLRSRFEGGMITDIDYPDFETRVAILKSKIQEKGLRLGDDVLHYIAENIDKNIRELEGALNKIMMHVRINNNPVTLDIAKKLLKNVFNAPKAVITPSKVIKAVANFYDLKERDILNISRKKEIVKPRQVVMYLLREDLSFSFPFIGKKLGGKDHTTAIHSCKKIEEELKTNTGLREEIELIRQFINAL
jgi:chromosomal replication initiator protein